ncbi:hypothetical protein SeLEV6574_g00156 [Synchytrium endobioticum]|nr:hypothetical protein SeLEV6574_g00156 [Synchytrium endobioticum]
MPMSAAYTIAAALLSSLILYRFLKAVSHQTRLQGQSVLVIGASDGIGRAIAHLYAKRHSNLVLVARRHAVLEQVASECTALGCADVACIALDVSVESNVVRLREEVGRSMAGVDVLVLCVGVLGVKLFEEISPADACHMADKMMSVNVLAPIFISAYFLDMLKLSKGRIIIVSSTAGVLPAPSRAVYAASKYALNGFFKSLRIEIAKNGVSITIASPGTVDTDFRSKALDATCGSTIPSRLSTKDSAPPRRKKVEPAKVTPDAAAKYIVEAADRRDREIVFPWFYKIAMIISAIWPSFTDLLAKVKYGIK